MNFYERIHFNDIQEIWTIFLNYILELILLVLDLCFIKLLYSCSFDIVLIFKIITDAKFANHCSIYSYCQVLLR